MRRCIRAMAGGVIGLTLVTACARTALGLEWPTPEKDPKDGTLKPEFISDVAPSEPARKGSRTLRSMQGQDQSVYALPTPQTEEQGSNTGGINLDMKVTYLTDHIYRGLDRSEALNLADEQDDEDDAEDQANFQFDGILSFNLDKLPHPFIGIFTNVLDADPVSNFQEVRPFFGAEWRIRPLILAGGNNLYQFPDRDELNTAEVWGRITLDDAAVFRLDEPFLSPYVYGAYDYDEYNGWYIEAGVTHDFVIEDTGITITAQASVAYVYNHQYFAGPEGDDTGLHHYGFGVIGKYSLNTLLNIPRRYGQWSFNGYLFYTDGIDDDLASDSDLWGGAGIQLTYGEHAPSTPLVTWATSPCEQRRVSRNLGFPQEKH